LRGQPIIVVRTLTDSAVAIVASYAAKAFGIKTGTLMRDAHQLCPHVVPVQANHRLYTEYHERILNAVDTCLPVEKVCSIDEMACKLMASERQVPDGLVVITKNAIETLIEGAAAETSWIGIALTAGTLVLCPCLGIAKQRIGEKLGPRATYGEGTQNVLCAILAGAVLVGLAANTLFGLWWLDPAIALAISALCLREGQKACRGEECGCATCS